MFLQTRRRLLAVGGRGILEILKNPNPEVEASKRDQVFIFRHLTHLRRLRESACANHSYSLTVVSAVALET